MRTSLAAFAAFILFAAIPAMADPLILVQSAQPVPHTFAGRSIDVLGIKLGMTPDQVKSILAKEYGVYGAENRLTPSNHFIFDKYNGIPVQTSYVLFGLSASKPNDKITVMFGFPSTGGGVIGVGRSVTFPDTLTAPRLSDVVDQLHAKYGPSSSPQPFGNGTKVDEWIYRTDGSLIPCASGPCSFFAIEPSEADINLSGQRAKAGAAVSIRAEMPLVPADATRANILTVTVMDDENAALSYAEARKQMQAAAAAEYARKAIPQAPPRL